MYKYSEHSSVKGKPFSFVGLILLIIVGLGGSFYLKDDKVLLMVDLVVIIASLMVLLIWIFKNKANKLMASDNEILFEVGLLSKSRAEVLSSSVRTVKIKQSFLNRIFGVGTIEIYTSGDNPEIVAKAMPKPHEFRELIKS
jgi:uncharacterized membrane protein YdbT with pleckstrin-like domain